mmetsp:Transcript_11175/g.41802  ORF Transcript_11175/g.41802 Transcript_11175/m.41802 type:complete len:85 (-) Transcript_11175:472-726(-)
MMLVLWVIVARGKNLGFWGQFAAHTNSPGSGTGPEYLTLHNLEISLKFSCFAVCINSNKTLSEVEITAPACLIRSKANFLSCTL